jgi:DinB superfamily
LDDDLQRALEAVEAATATITAAQLVRRRPGKWSAAEIVEHCALACGATSKLLRWYLDGGKLKGSEPTEEQRAMTKFVIGGGQFPPGLKAPPFAVPRGMEPERVLVVFREALVVLDATVARCDGAFGGEVTLGRHPILGPLTGKQWCRFHRVHTSHHARQIEDIRLRAADDGAAG